MKAEESIDGRGEERLSRAWIALLPVAALLITGCGGGGGDPSSSTTTGGSPAALTKAELLDQGNAICAKAYPAIAEFDPEGTTKEAVRAADLTGGMAEDLLDLGVPEETEFVYGEYLKTARALAEAASAAKHSTGNPASLKDAEAAYLSYLNSFQNWSSEYGLKECNLVAYMAAEESSQAP